MAGVRAERGHRHKDKSHDNKKTTSALGEGIADEHSRKAAVWIQSYKVLSKVI